MTVEDFYDEACIKFNFTGWRIVNNVIYLENTDGSVSEKQIKDKAQELFQEWQSLQYQRDRASQYPSYADQFDTIYHQGIDAWKAEIKKVKDANPKPSE